MSEHLPVEGSSSWHERLALLSPSLAGRPARHLVGLALVALLVVLAGAGIAWWLFRAPPPPVELSLPMATAAPPVGTGGGDTSGPGGAGGATSPTTPSTAVVVVQAAGAVVHPGVYELPADARVADLVAVAGGPAEGADADRLALAALLVDGQRVYVPSIGEDVPPSVAPVAGGGGSGGGAGAGAGSGGAGGGPATPLDLNTAAADALEGLPGVGPATAAAIVTHRDRHGPFRSVEDLLDVPGIGPAKLAALRDQVRV